MLRLSYLAVVICCLASVSPGEEFAVIFADDFSSVAGFYSTNLNQSYVRSQRERTRQGHSYMADPTEDGELQITIREDNKTNGVDGKPGVLSLSYDSLPSEIQYSGCIYAGTVKRPLALPRWKTEATASDLEKVQVGFWYKATHKNEANVGLDVNFRFEPETDRAYEERIDFGVLKASSQWQEFKMTLAGGTNQAKFLESVNGRSDQTFKLAWGQEGAIDNYQDGDTLLIDNIKITVLK